MKSKCNMPQFFICNACGNLVEMISPSGMPIICCGEEMTELKAGTSDGKVEFHVPFYKIENEKVTVCIGKEPHPMSTAHHIEWVEMVTDRGIYRKCLQPDTEPRTCFHISRKESVICIYSYCNIHGLFQVCAEDC